MARPEALPVINEVKNLVNSDDSRIVELALSKGVYSNALRFAQSLIYQVEHPIFPAKEDAYATFHSTFKSAWHYVGRPEVVFVKTSIREIEEFCNELFEKGSRRDFRTFLAINDALLRQTGHSTVLLTKIEADNSNL